MSKEAAMAIATGQPVPVEIAAPVETKVEAPKDLDSARFAQLAKKEAEFVRRQQQLKADQDKFGAERTQVEAILKKRDLFEETRKKDPVEALRMIGFNETEVFNFLAAQEKPEKTPEEKAAEAAAKATDERLQAYEKAQADKEAKAVKERDNQLLTSFKSDLGSVIESDKDKFEYCAHYGPAAVDLAYRTVLAIVEESKGEDIPSAQEAMEMIEELYEEEDKRLMGLKKRQPKQEVKAEEVKSSPERSRVVTTPPGHTPPAPTIQRTRTLSNDVRATANGLARTGKETPSQKRERLIEALRRGKI